MLGVAWETRYLQLWRLCFPKCFVIRSHWSQRFPCPCFLVGTRWAHICFSVSLEGGPCKVEGIMNPSSSQTQATSIEASLVLWVIPGILAFQFRIRSLVHGKYHQSHQLLARVSWAFAEGMIEGLYCSLSKQLLKH